VAETLRPTVHSEERGEHFVAEPAVGGRDDPLEEQIPGGGKDVGAGVGAEAGMVARICEVAVGHTAALVSLQQVGTLEGECGDASA